MSAIQTRNDSSLW